MAHHLYITASVRTEGSKSGELGQFFKDALAKKDPQATFKLRDVGINPPPHPSHAYTVANYTAPNERTPEMAETLKTSDLLIDEMLAADTLIVALPMYNFSVPSTFKAYIDNLVRIGRTFFPAEGGAFTGALSEKKAIFITARGAMYGEDSPIKDFDLQTPWLQTVYGFMGLTDMPSYMLTGLTLVARSIERKASLMQNPSCSILCKHGKCNALKGKSRRRRVTRHSVTAECP